jgi:predicted NBD/HSP70 family sugar kinase
MGEPQGEVPRGAGAEEVRRHNLSALLAHVHLRGPTSRSHLASITGLNRSTIADLVGELSALGLVAEQRTPTTAGPGRPSPVVEIKPEGAVVLALELAVDSIAIATVGLGGHIFNLVRIDRPRGRFSPDETVEDVVKLAEPLLAALPLHHRFAGVGVAVVGITRAADGFVHLAPNLGWRDVPLGEMLKARLAVDGPISVANEADLGALSEHRRGVSPGVDNLLFVSGEVGIGLGVILGGQARLGAAGYAGEAGHTLVNPAGTRCRCGAIGCWETEAGEGALLRHAGPAVGEGGRASIDRVMTLAAAGDETVLGALAYVGRWLGLGIADLINLFNPELVVLGGMFDRLYPLIEPSMREGVRSRVLEAPGAMATIAPSALGIDAPLLGAAELALSGVIDHPNRAIAGRTANRRTTNGRAMNPKTHDTARSGR